MTFLAMETNSIKPVCLKALVLFPVKSSISHYTRKFFFLESGLSLNTTVNVFSVPLYICPTAADHAFSPSLADNVSSTC